MSIDAFTPLLQKLHASQPLRERIPAYREGSACCHGCGIRDYPIAPAVRSGNVAQNACLLQAGASSLLCWHETRFCQIFYATLGFIDSNIFVYLFDSTSPNKRYRAEKLIADALQMGNACISYQVAQETLNVITTKLRVNATAEQANAFLLDALIPLWKINPTRELYLRSLSVQSRYRYSFYDSLIIAAALEAGCNTLYSEDMQHGQCIEQLSIKNTFLE